MYRSVGAEFHLIVEATLLAMVRLSSSAFLVVLVGWVASYVALGSGVDYAEVRSGTAAPMQERTYKVMEALDTMQGRSRETGAALDKLVDSCHRAPRRRS